MRYLLFITIAFIGFSNELYAQPATDRVNSKVDFVFHFRFDKYVLDSAFMDNRKTLSQLDNFLSHQDFIETLDSIVIIGSASPEGVIEHNNRLARQRSKAIKDYIVWKYPFIDQKLIRANHIGENWDGLRTMVENDLEVPYREQTLKTLNLDINQKTKEWRIKQINNGASWKYIENNYMKSLRSGVICAVFYKPVSESKKKIEEISPRNSEQIYNSKPVEQPSDTAKSPLKWISPIKTFKPVIAIKTNIAAYAAFVANIAVEIPLGRHISLDLPLYYSPYTVFKNYKFRLLASQPEFKYWINNPFKGHFFGAYLVGGWYNIAVDSRNRYQDKDGRRPAYGAGLSYGYAISMGKHWGLEFTAGFGYLYFDHDVFYNVDKGAKFDSRRVHYWGPTKLGINLIYKLNKPSAL